MKHLRIKIFGAVQGVGFRWSAKRRAAALGITGFARNDPDGTVCIEAEGTDHGLSEFLAWCRRGSSYSSVRQVDIEAIESSEVERYKSFSVQ